jgi:hypothetical protein
MANVPGDTSTVLMFFGTIKMLYQHRPDLKQSLLRSLLRMTIKAPILLDLVLDFVKDEPEAVEVLSKKYPVNVISDSIWGVMTMANQFYKFGTDYPKCKVCCKELEE